MAVYSWLIGAIILNVGCTVNAHHHPHHHHHNSSIYPPDLTTICHDDSLTKGYKCEDYDVITEDGYILRLHRFPEGRINYSGRKKKQPVYLQHGVLVDGANWFTVSHADQALPIILVEAGFDVWIGNSRGTRYSRKHISANFTNSNNYWDFSFSELGRYDLTASINFVYQETGQKVHYAGHSLGTTMFFAAFSEWEVAEKVKSATLLSPIAFLNHITTPLGVIPAHAYAAEISGAFGISFLDLKIEPLGAITYALCNVPGVNCWDVFAAFSDIRTGIFSAYDYGNPATNLEHYGVLKPPLYDLQKIPKNFPMLLCHGGADALADPKDVHRVLSILNSHEDIHEIYIDNYAHYDFINAMTAKDFLYPDVVNFMKAH